MEEERVLERYENRRTLPYERYDFQNHAFFFSEQEKENALHAWLRHSGITPHDASLIEIGCGTGKDLRKFINLGFSPHQLTGNELIPSRIASCKQNLPEKIQVIDGSALELPDLTYDIVYQSTVFSSILDDTYQHRMADKMWSMANRGVLWYDFIYNNPQNKDVRGVSVDRIKELFPKGKVHVWKITLAPPISRLVTKIHPNLYHVFNAFPILRTHVLCWIEK